MEAIGGKTWIHIVAAGTGNQPHEIWLSFPRDVAASRNNGHHIRYDDLRTGVSYQYLPHDNKLFRCSVEAMAAESFRSIAGVFQAIFRGDVSLGERFFEYEIVRQRQRTVDDRGQSWIEYELDFEFPNQTAAAVIRVDPKAMLPSSLTFTVTSPNEEMRIEFAVDYPDDGPADIYAIGVPRDAPVEDRLPSAELTQVLEAIDQGRRDLDNYFAIVASSPNDLPRLVWRKGDKWRVDICQPTEQTDYVDRVEPGTDMLKWWRERLKLFCILPYLVCDGRQIDRCWSEMEDGKPASSGWKLVEKVQGKDHTGESRFCDSRSHLVELRRISIETEHEIGHRAAVHNSFGPARWERPCRQRSGGTLAFGCYKAIGSETAVLARSRAKLRPRPGRDDRLGPCFDREIRDPRVGRLSPIAARRVVSNRHPLGDRNRRANALLLPRFRR